jgi:hypothetical protein
VTLRVLRRYSLAEGLLSVPEDKRDFTFMRKGSAAEGKVRLLKGLGAGGP